MDIIEIAAIIVTGAVGCAEFGSATMVHPVIRKLRVDEQLVFEKGLLAAPSGWLITAAVSLGLALAVTIIGNVTINLRTGRIRETSAPEDFIAMRRRWDVFQIVRATLQLIGFVLVTIGVVSGT